MPDRKPRASSIRCLADIHLDPAEYRSLARQGFVAQEYRASAGPFFKLRFRFEGNQKVRYLGANPDVAKALATELSVLQATCRLDQQLRRLTFEAKSLLRQAKA